MKLNNIIILIPFLFLRSLLGFNIWGNLYSVTFNSLLYGFVIPTFTFLIGVISIRIGLDKSDKTFLVAVFGGLILRLFIVLILIILTLKFLFVSLNSFIFITFIFYFYYFIVEIIILTQKKNIKIKTNND